MDILKKPVSLLKTSKKNSKKFVCGGAFFVLGFGFPPFLGICKFLGQGLTLSPRCDLHCTYFNDRSLTCCTTVGTPSVYLSYWLL